MQLADVIEYALSTMVLTGVPASPAEFLEDWRGSPVEPTAFDELIERARAVEAMGAQGEEALADLGLALPTRAEAARHLIRLTLCAVESGREDPVEAVSFVHAQLLDELESTRGHAFSSPLRILPNAIGSSFGLEKVLSWLQEIWNCRSNASRLIHADLPRNEAERRLVGYLRESVHEWVVQYRRFA